MITINDQYIIEHYCNKRINVNKLSDSEKNYILQRFDDSESIHETLYRLKYGIEVRPKCFTCGGKVKFYGKKSYGFGKYCSKECKSHGEVGKLIKQTKLLKYGDQNYVNSEKAKHTCLVKYGVESVFQLDINIQKAKVTSKTLDVKEKIKQTCLTRYGVENPLNQQYVKEKAQANSKSKEVIDKIKQTWIDKTPDELESIKNKRKTAYNKKTDLEKQVIIQHRKETCIKKYNCSTGFGSHKTIETNIRKYGVENPAKSSIIREKLSNIISSEQVQTKIINTKRKNHTFNTSKQEDESYAILKEYYPNVITQYKDDRYPFACDFYIPSLDLFIECNYHWTHGGKPYEGTEDDKQIVEKWKAKNTKFYFNAIQTWTVRDVNKRNIAKQNKLNYIEVWNIKEIKKLLKNNDYSSTKDNKF